jgi:serine/threonine protein kinase
MPESLEVLLFTDLVDSTGLKTRLGDDEYARAVAIPHNTIFRQILTRFADAAEENYTGDGFLASFVRVQDAVHAALEFHRELARHPWTATQPFTRIGIHLGQVLRIPGPAGGRPQIASHSADLCARVMSLALPGQTLLTRHAFDNARQYVHRPRETAASTEPETLEWLSHGRYLFKGRDEAMEVFEVGVVGAAPLTAPPDSEKARRADSAEEELVRGWRPASGLEIPERHGWRLERQLGEGGFGEVWLARNERTRQQRVFKFCHDGVRLQSFKRELTLFRLLQEALGERPDIAKLHEVRLDARPYYLESQHLPGGDLVAWCAQHGGLAALPLETRLRLITQIAEAVAAAHSVGIIHRDLKPANVLMSAGDLAATPVLADFGIGAIADQALLARHGITAAGFTEKTLLTPGSSGSGTRMYLPPEAALGGAATMQGDVYALGVLLHQFVRGDFQLPLGPNWDRGFVVDTDDVDLTELLEADIRECVETNPQDRLASASHLAYRLKTMDSRVAAKARERQAQWITRRYQLARRWLMAATTCVVLLGCMTVFSVAQWRLAAILTVELHEKARDARDAQQVAERNALEARTQGDAARAAEQRATASAARADRERMIALDVLNKLVFDVQAELEGRPALNHLQQAVLETALEGLAQLGEATEAPRVDDRLSAMARFKIAGLSLSLGQVERARRELEQTHAVFVRLAAEQPDDITAQRDLSLSFQLLGQVARQAGELALARQMQTNSLELARGLADAAPEDLSWQRDLSIALGLMGELEEQTGRLSRTLELYREDLAIAQRLADLDPQDLRARRDLAISHNRIGQISLQMGDCAGARRAYELSRELSQALVEADPFNTQAQRDLAIVHNHLGLAARQARRLTDAETAFLEGLSITEQLAAALPDDPVAQQDLAISYDHLGGLAVQRGDLATALWYYEADVEIMRKLAAIDPTDATLSRGLAVALNGLGDAASAYGDLDAAERHYQDAFERTAKLAKIDDDNALLQRDLALAHENLGRLQLVHERYAAARELFERELTIVEDLRRLDQTNQDMERFTARVYDLLGETADGLEEPAVAHGWHEQSLALREALVARDPDDAESRRDLSYSHHVLASRAWNAGDLDTARHHFEADLALARPLAAIDPTHVEAQTDLALTLTELAGLEVDAGNPDRSRQLYHEGLELVRRMRDAELDLGDYHDEARDWEWRLAALEWSATSNERRQTVLTNLWRTTRATATECYRHSHPGRPWSPEGSLLDTVASGLAGLPSRHLFYYFSQAVYALERTTGWYWHELDELVAELTWLEAAAAPAIR